MLISLNKKVDNNKKSTPLEKRFHKLQQQLQRQKRLNTQFTQELEELTRTYYQTIRASNLKQLETLIELTEKLTKFVGRKSLSKWHREEIDDWVMDLVMNQVAPVEPNTAVTLKNRYVQSIAGSMGLTVEQFQESIEGAIEEEADDIETAEETFQEDLFGYDDFLQDGPDDPFDETVQQSETPELPQYQNNSDDWMKTLFRRAAQNLHPDRETDPERQKHKQQLLSELLTARKEKDILTMLEIFGKALDKPQLDLAETELAAVCDMLADQLEYLKFEQTCFIDEHPDRVFVYETFYHKNKKKRETALKQWRQELEMQAKQNRRLAAYLRNLTNLKEVLADRRQQRYEFIEFMMEDMIHDIPF